MAKEVIMPKLGMTMETGTIIRWYKEEGEPVQTGDLLLEVMTDKINIGVESYETGVLLKKYYGEDDVVPVNRVIAYIGAADEQVPDAPPDGEAAPVQASAQPESAESAAAGAPAAGGADGAGVRATPAARRLAEERGVPLAEVPGSGERGRIHADDVAAYAERRDVRATPLARKLAAAAGVDLREVHGSGPHGKVTRADLSGPPAPSEERAEGDSLRKLDGMRQIIAERMVRSAFTAPHVALHTEADMARAVELRTSLLPVIEEETGFRLSYTEIIVKATAASLRRHPHLRERLEGDMIRTVSGIHIGLAVSVPNGLIVPVIADADRKGLAQLTRECKELARLARENRLAPNQTGGGAFTISNLGMYAVDHFNPIINQPESAILGVGRIVEKAVGVEGQIVLRPMMALSLSFDHRVIDGAIAAAFLTELKRRLENPFELLA